MPKRDRSKEHPIDGFFKTLETKQKLDRIWDDPKPASKPAPKERPYDFGGYSGDYSGDFYRPPHPRPKMGWSDVVLWAVISSILFTGIWLAFNGSIVVGIIFGSIAFMLAMACVATY